MRTASFREILEEKMANEIPRPEVSSPDLDPAGLAFLLGQVDRFKFKRPSSYPRPPAKGPVKAKIRERKTAHKLSDSQKESFSYFAKLGFPLEPDFTPEELKTAFRRSALITHPDRGGTAIQFMELQKHHENLKNIFLPSHK